MLPCGIPVPLHGCVGGGGRSDGRCLRSRVGRTLASFCVYNWICDSSRESLSSTSLLQLPLPAALAPGKPVPKTGLKMEKSDAALCLSMPFPSSSGQLGCAAGGESLPLPDLQLLPLHFWLGGDPSHPVYFSDHSSSVFCCSHTSRY